MIETISIFIHILYLSIYLFYLKFLNKISKEKIIFALLLVYFFLPGRFSTLSIYDIYFNKVYIFIFLLPLFIKEIIFFNSKSSNKNKNYIILLIFIPIGYLFLFFLKSSEIFNYGYSLHFKNYFLDLVNSILFIIYLFNNEKVDLNKLSYYIKKFFYVAIFFLGIEFLVFIVFKIQNINFYDKSGAFNSIFFSSFFVTSLFAGIAILFSLFRLFKYKKLRNIPILFLLTSIIIINIESRAIILSLIISSLSLIFIIFKKNIFVRFSIIFLSLFIAKISINFDQCTYLESNFFKLMNKYDIKSKNLCDYESSYYRFGLLQREVDVILTNLPFGVGPGVGKFYYNDIETSNFLYSEKKLGYKFREVYADILSVHFVNSQIYPPQPSNMLTDMLMSYGINIILLIIIIYIIISKRYGLSKKKYSNVYSMCLLFIILNFVFNSTSGLFMLQILMTLLALSYKNENDVKTI